MSSSFRNLASFENNLMEKDNFEAFGRPFNVCAAISSPGAAVAEYVTVV